MWTLQEALAASPDSLVLCGDKSASWGSVIRALENLSIMDLCNKGRSSCLPNYTMFMQFDAVRVSRENGKKVTLEDLLLSTADRDASGPRDHIYAVLGLISDPRSGQIEPDYSKQPSWVNQQAMVSIFNSREDLDWLLYAIGEATSAKPSWCVDFSMK